MKHRYEEGKGGNAAMRVLGISQKWSKLKQDEFTTFRFTRKDKDWGVGEQVQVVYHPRGKDREVLGVAEITGKERKSFYNITSDDRQHLVSIHEAQADGFADFECMVKWLIKTYGDRLRKETMNKLTLRWRSRNDGTN
jgi:hypothetical protein